MTFKNLIKTLMNCKALMFTTVSIAITNAANASYAYWHGVAYGNRRGFLNAYANNFVVWYNIIFSVIASISWFVLSFK